MLTYTVLGSLLLILSVATVIEIQFMTQCVAGHDAWVIGTLLALQFYS